jgi:hypothetical protein
VNDWLVLTCFSMEVGEIQKRDLKSYKMVTVILEGFFYAMENFSLYSPS